jgi:3-oxoacyl-[acyl-carrier protein] reductase
MLAASPLGRAGTEADIAHAVLYSALEDAGYVTGAVLDVNDGMFMGG